MSGGTGGLPVALRGRGRETGTVLRTLTQVTETGLGAFLLITGEPGIGKSALLDAAVEQARRAGFAVGVGKAEEIEQIAPGAPLLVALRSGRHPLLDVEAFAGLAALHDQPLWLVDRIAGLIEGLARSSPVAVAIDDVQWADPLTRFALRMLPGRLVESPVVWMLISRRATNGVVEEVTAAAAGVPVERVELGPLRPVDVDDLVRDRLGSTPDDATRRQLQRVGGNPFWVVQLLSSLSRSRATADVHPTGEMQAGVRRRVASLDVDTRRLLQLVAVRGRTADAADVTALLGDASFGRTLELREAGVAAGLLTGDGSEIGLPHDLVRESIYLDIPLPDRRRLHRAWGRRLLLAGQGLMAAAPHFRASATEGDTEALSVLRRAALQCAASMPDTAADLASEAFGLLPPGHELWAEVGEECADLLTRVQHERAAVAVADAVLARSHDVDVVARLQFLACCALWPMGQLAEIDRRIDAVLSRPGVPDVQRARLDTVRALTLTRAGTLVAARNAAESALAEGVRLGDDLTRRRALVVLAEAARNEGRHDESLDRFRALREFTDPRYVAEEVRGLQLLDRYDEAGSALVEAVRVQADARAVAPALLYAQMWQDLDLGRFDAAESGARTVLRVSDELGNRAYRLHARVLLCGVSMYRGDLAQARQWLTPEGRLAERDDVRLTSLRVMDGWLRAEEGDTGAGAAILRPLLDPARTSRSVWPWYPTYMRTFARIGVAAGDAGLAQDAVGVADLGAERNPGVASFVGLAAQVRGYVARDPLQSRRAVDVLRAGPRPLLLADALADLGSVLLDVGEPGAAVEALRAAEQAYGALGVHAGVDSVRQQLTGAGQPTAGWPGSRPVSGWAALTGSERRVAELIAAGHTNRSAAIALGVSPNTVGTQLRAVFGKLDVRSRVQLANAVRIRRDPGAGGGGDRG